MRRRRLRRRTTMRRRDSLLRRRLPNASQTNCTRRSAAPPSSGGPTALRGSRLLRRCSTASTPSRLAGNLDVILLLLGRRPAPRTPVHGRARRAVLDPPASSRGLRSALAVRCARYVRIAYFAANTDRQIWRDRSSASHVRRTGHAQNTAYVSGAAQFVRRALAGAEPTPSILAALRLPWWRRGSTRRREHSNRRTTRSTILGRSGPWHWPTCRRLVGPR